MHILEAVFTRNSVGKLSEPAPRGEDLANILDAAVRANDHQRLRPWQFLIIEGDARAKLGQIFVDVALQRDPTLSQEKQADIAAKTQRAPLIVVVVAKIQEHPKVPTIEQVLSAGGAAQLIMLAAHGLGFAGVWRTGDMAYDAGVRQRLGLQESDQIVGFLYLGTALTPKKLTEINHKDYTVVWNG
ncbi:MAG TPA: nitroreductase [Spongiibacteraceae bacterium]|nr:nitroreductase [Spongiibacteraceae bacterium]